MFAALLCDAKSVIGRGDKEISTATIIQLKSVKDMYAWVFLFLVVANSAVAFPHRALWLWNTEELIARPELRDTLLRVRDELDIQDVFLNFPHRFELREDRIHCVLLQEDSIAALVRWASAQGFRIFALAGEPEWALPKFAGYAEAFTRAVLQFAQQLPHAGTISGIHLDVEPHLLIQFASPVLRTQLYRSKIRLHGRLAEIIHANSTLEYGADIPFWMHDSVSFDGKRAPVVEHLWQRVDHLSVLVYRDHAEGPNGILKLAERHVAMAEKVGKQVYIGVETQELRFREFQFILGKSERNYRAALTGSCRDVPSVLNSGDRIAAVEVFGTIHVGVPTMASQDDLLRIAECFGRSINDLDAKYVREELDKLSFWCRHLGEWENPELDVVIDLKGKRFRTFLMRQKVLPHISFWEEPSTHFRLEVAKVDSAFSQRSGYRGLAVHDFRWVSYLILER